MNVTFGAFWFRTYVFKRRPGSYQYSYFTVEGTGSVGTQMTHCKQVNKARHESSSQPRTARPSTACIVLSVVIGQPALGDVSEVICACHPHGAMAPLSFPPTRLSLLSGILRPSSNRQHWTLQCCWCMENTPTCNCHSNWKGFLYQNRFGHWVQNGQWSKIVCIERAQPTQAECPEDSGQSSSLCPALIILGFFKLVSPFCSECWTGEAIGAVWKGCWLLNWYSMSFTSSATQGPQLPGSVQSFPMRSTRKRVINHPFLNCWESLQPSINGISNFEVWGGELTVAGPRTGEALDSLERGCLI